MQVHVYGLHGVHVYRLHNWVQVTVILVPATSMAYCSSKCLSISSTHYTTCLIERHDIIYRPLIVATTIVVDTGRYYTVSYRSVYFRGYLVMLPNHGKFIKKTDISF